MHRASPKTTGGVPISRLRETAYGRLRHLEETTGLIVLPEREGDQPGGLDTSMLGRSRYGREVV